MSYIQAPRLHFAGNFQVLISLLLHCRPLRLEGLSVMMDHLVFRSIC